VPAELRAHGRRDLAGEVAVGDRARASAVRSTNQELTTEARCHTSATDVDRVLVRREVR
jgi:hypothetical protein